MVVVVAAWALVRPGQVRLRWAGRQAVEGMLRPSIDVLARADEQRREILENVEVDEVQDCLASTVHGPTGKAVSRGVCGWCVGANTVHVRTPTGRLVLGKPAPTRLCCG